MVGSHKKLFCQTNFPSFSLTRRSFCFPRRWRWRRWWWVSGGILKNSAKAYISKENKNQRTAKEFHHQTKIKIQFAENYTAFLLELLAFLLLALRFGATKQKTRFLKCSVRSKRLHWRTFFATWIPSLLAVNDHKAAPVQSFVNARRCPSKMSVSWKERLRASLPALIRHVCFGIFHIHSPDINTRSNKFVGNHASHDSFSSQNQIFFSSDFTSFPHGLPRFQPSPPPARFHRSHCCSSHSGVVQTIDGK